MAGMPSRADGPVRAGPCHRTFARLRLGHRPSVPQPCPPQPPHTSQRGRQPPVNANDATLTSLATAQTGSRVADTTPNAPANPGFDLVLEAVAGSALGSSGAPYTLTI